MVTKNKKVWLTFEFGRDSYNTKLLRATIDKLKKAGYKFSNPNIPTEEWYRGYYSMIDGVYFESHADDMDLVGAQTKIDSIREVLRKHFKARRLWYAEFYNVF